MKANSIVPENESSWLEMRASNINSTEASALFGLSKRITDFELFHQKRNKEIVRVDETTRMKWGKRLQNVIAAAVAEEHGFKDARPMPEYMWIPDLRMGSSFDWAIGEDGLLEVKNIDYFRFKDEWLVDDNGNIEASPAIELQCQQELAVSGRKFLKLVVLVGGNQEHVIHREPDSKVISLIESKIAEFWKLVDADTPPMPDFSKDSEFISRLYGYSAPGLIMDAKDNPAINMLAGEYRALGEQAKIMEARRDEVKARLMTMIGGAEKILGDGFSISAKTTPESEVAAYTRKSFRALRFSWSKGDKK